MDAAKTGLEKAVSTRSYHWHKQSKIRLFSYIFHIQIRQNTRGTTL